MDMTHIQDPKEENGVVREDRELSIQGLKDIEGRA